MVTVPQTVVRRHLTFADYQALPDDQDYEIIAGVLHVAPRPRPRHQIVAHKLAVLLTEAARTAGLGTVVPDADLIISERDVYISPDIMYFADDRFSSVDPDGWIRILPDLIVEVLSPSSEEYDRATKKRLYRELGVPHYWIVDPRLGTLTECVLQPGGQYRERTIEQTGIFRPALFPGWEVSLAEVGRGI